MCLVSTARFKGLSSGGMHRDLKTAFYSSQSYHMECETSFEASEFLMNIDRWTFIQKKGEVDRALLNYNSDSTI